MMDQDVKFAHICRSFIKPKKEERELRTQPFVSASEIQLKHMISNKILHSTFKKESSEKAITA